MKEADIVVAAIGKANFVKGEWLKEGATVRMALGVRFFWGPLCRVKRKRPNEGGALCTMQN